MRIITVNLPQSYIKAIDTLTGHDGLYPSRSELIRVVVREYLIREIDAAKAFQKFTQSKSLPPINENLCVRVPVEDKLQEYKTYRLVKRS